jgi:NADPH2:quinone reductase
MRAIQIKSNGGPEVLECVDLPAPEPGPGQVRIRNHAIGVNFIDTYHRNGLYPVPLPFVLGTEGAGEVEAVGEDVSRFKVGDRVAYAVRILGAYAEQHVLPEDQVVAIPDELSYEDAAAVILKGMTAEYLLRRCYPLKAGDACLVWAASGGMGTLLCQWAHAIGAVVIGVVGSEAKAELARSNGCDHVLNHRTDDVAARVREITGGAGVRVSYDGVGKASFDASMKSLGRRGMLVSFGNASGPAPAVEPLALSRGGSLFLTRPTLFDYVTNAEELDECAGAVFEALRSGAIRAEVGAKYPLAEARKVHEALEASETIGSTILIP